MNNQEQTEDKKLTPIQEKRKELRELSNELKEDLAEGEKLNDLIIEHYKEGNPEIESFNTYRGWRKEGFQVKKGEKAFLVWGRPKNLQEGESQQATDDGDEDKDFYPVAFIFSNLQVRALQQEAEAA